MIVFTNGPNDFAGHCHYFVIENARRNLAHPINQFNWFFWSSRTFEIAGCALKTWSALYSFSRMLPCFRTINSFSKIVYVHFLTSKHVESKLIDSLIPIACSTRTQCGLTQKKVRYTWISISIVTETGFMCVLWFFSLYNWNILECGALLRMR